MKKSLRLMIPVLFATATAYSQVVTLKTAREPQDVPYVPFTLEQVLSYPFPSDLTASSKGERIAWASDAQGKRNIWVAEGPMYFNTRQLTKYNEDTGQELSGLEFSADGNWIVFVRGQGKNSAGEFANPTSDATGVRQQVLAVNWVTGQVRTVGDGTSPLPSPTGSQIIYASEDKLMVVSLADPASKPTQIFNARGTIGAPHWSPDGRYIAFASGRRDHSFIGVYDTVAKNIRYLSPSVDRDSAPRWSPDGKQIAFVRRAAVGNQTPLFLDDTPDPWTIWVADLATGNAHKIWESGKTPNDAGLGGEHQLQWAAEGRIVITSEMDGWRHLYSMPVAGGKAELLTPGECEVEDITYTADRRTIIYNSNCGDIDRRHLWSVAVTGGPPKPLMAGSDSIEWSPVVTGDGKHIVFLSSNDKFPATPYYMPPDGSFTRSIGNERAPKDFPWRQMARPAEVTFKAADGQEIHGQLFFPPTGRYNSKMPAVIFMHGGPIRQMLLGWHYNYYYHNSYAFNQYLASRGYTVLSVNYRTGIGYGRAFRLAPKRGARGASEYQDIVAAANYLRSRKDIDDKKIGLWGGSYGGYLTALGLARNSDLFAAGVDLHGVHDWSQRISGAAWIDYNNRDAVRTALEASPVSSINKWKSPVLLIQGDDDRNVAFSQMIDLARRLREQNVEFEQIVFPDDVHDFLLHKNWLRAYHAASDFFDKHLKRGSVPGSN